MPPPSPTPPAHLPPPAPNVAAAAAAVAVDADAAEEVREGFRCRAAALSVLDSPVAAVVADR